MRASEVVHLTGPFRQRFVRREIESSTPPSDRPTVALAGFRAPLPASSILQLRGRTLRPLDRRPGCEAACASFRVRATVLPDPPDEPRHPEVDLVFHEIGTR